jgi:hypothetical protein
MYATEKLLARFILAVQPTLRAAASIAGKQSIRQR